MDNSTHVASRTDTPVLQIKDLRTFFDTRDGTVRAVNGVSLEVYAGETLCIVGESGCGKSVTAMTVLGLLPMPPARIETGEILFQGTDLLKLSENEMQTIRGNDISMIFQEPMTSLNPVLTVGEQISEAISLHQKVSDRVARNQAVEILDRVRVPDPRQRAGEYPHQLSGGMRQRVVIAIALACKPALLIADEPTTALDVTIQAQILELIKELQADMGMSVILITHDLGVIAETCEQVVVMYAGKIAEKGSVYDVFDSPSHPYTRGLLASIPRLDTEPKSKLSIIEGMVPGLLDLPPGCRFENRCRFAEDSCTLSAPPIHTIQGQHDVSCFRWQDI